VRVLEDGLSQPATASAGDSEFADSIAILPFENSETEEEAAYLGEGISAGVGENLTQLPRLRVVPHTKAMKYGGPGQNAVQAGRELGARVVLIGQATLKDEILGIRATLIDAELGSQVWNACYERRAQDIFSIQAEIVEQIKSRLMLSGDHGQRKISAWRPTESREAYFLYLRGMHWMGKFSTEGMKRAIDFARRAIDADPAFARAWSMFAYLLVMIGYVDGAPPLVAFPKAKSAAMRALEIDDDEADAHAALAFVHLLHEWDWPSARRELDRALALRPNLAVAHFIYSQWYLTQGLFERAIVEGQVALEIDPLSAIYSCCLAQIYFHYRDHDRAIEQLERTIDIDPGFRAAHLIASLIYANKGMRSEAVAALEQGFEDSKDQIRSKAFQGIVGALTGVPKETSEAIASLEVELKPPHFSSAYHSAILHALLGEIDKAFTCLEMAWQGRSNRLVFLAVSSNLSNLHGDPRFTEFRRRIGIPEGRP
jgi:TolB-like protein